MSSTYGKYNAERVLGRQKGQEIRRTKDYFKKAKMPYDWGMHASMKNDQFTQSSCAITAEENANDKDQYWKADFANG